MNYEIKYLPDAAVDEAMDLKLRKLLHACFSENESNDFEHKRYYHELPRHRWIIEADDALIAHVAAHEKRFSTQATIHAFLGIAEVCVAKAHRGKGFVKAILKKLELDFPEFTYAILLGDEQVYGSSGYETVSNIYFPEVSDTPSNDTMVKCFRGASWPKDRVTIEGVTF